MNVGDSELRRRLEESCRCHRVPGVSVAVFEKGRVVTAAAGMANMKSGVALTPDTVMHIGSITKVFNATLVMQMVEQGSLDLEEPVLRYLPELRLKDSDALERLTLRMLLDHTSGIDGAALPDHGHDEETIEKGIGRMASFGQIHRPGAEFSYCNAGTVIAGYLAQRLSGKSWYRLIREKIFEPLEMTHAATLPEEALLHRASVGHYLDPSTRELFRTSSAFLPMSFAPAGVTLMLSATDLIAFARAHMDFGKGPNGARILSQSSAQIMQHMSVNNCGKGYTTDLDIGIGWMLSGRLLTHSGAAPGAVAALYAHPEREWAVAILVNAAHGAGLITDIMRPWLDELGIAHRMQPSDADLPTPLQLSSAEMERYVGVYEDGIARFHVARTAAGLTISQQPKWAYYENLSTDRSPPVALVALGEHRFFWKPHGGGGPQLCAFRAPTRAGNMRYFGYSLRLFPRIA